MINDLPPKVVFVKALENRQLWLVYDNGYQGIVNLRPILALDGPIFKGIKDNDILFSNVGIDTFGSICWPDGADIAPEWLYEQALMTPVTPGELDVRAA